MKKAWGYFVRISECVLQSFLALVMISALLTTPVMLLTAILPQCETVVPLVAMRHVKCYTRVGAIEIKSANGIGQAAVYKAENKPFLIVGPYRFTDADETYRDFFFVNRKQVICTAIDKDGSAWLQFFRWLFILDDLSDYWNLVRAPFWDELKNPGASVRFDDRERCYIYTLRCKAPDGPVYFAIPDEFFTPDMLDAPNATLKF
jgi:hypothetical protein